jgi:hypothetical protein
MTTKLRIAVVATIVCSVLGATTAAFAFFTSSGTGSAFAAASTLLPPTGLTSPSSASMSITLAWVAPANGPAPISYTVKRCAGSSCTPSAAIAAGSCSGAITAATCVDNDPALNPNNFYTYAVLSVRNNWTSIDSATFTGQTKNLSDNTPPTVTINQAGAQSDPTSSSPINFTAVFSEAVTGFTSSSVSLSGTAGAGTVVVTGTGPTYNVAVSGMVTNGTVIATIAAGAVQDLASNPNTASTSTDNTVTWTGSGDTTAPALTTLEMFDTNGNGKIDQVKATFDETLASTTNTGQWTLANVPSGGSLSTVSTSGTVATLTLTEGTGAANTAVGTFTVALTASAAGIRDAAGNQSSFAARAPTDKAAPVPVSVALANGNNASDLGILSKKDTIAVGYSEALSATSVCSAGLTSSLSSTLILTVADGGPNDTFTASSSACSSGMHAGSITLGGNYVTATATWGNTSPGNNNSSVGVSGSTITFTFGGLNGGTANATAQPLGTAVYTPDTAITDAAGNAMTSTAFTAPATSRF